MDSLIIKITRNFKFTNRLILFAVIKVALLAVFSMTLLTPAIEQVSAQDTSCPQSHPEACGNIGPNGEEVCSANDDCSSENITVNANTGPDCRDNPGYCETLSPSCPSGTSGGDVVCNQDTGWCETVSCSEANQDTSNSSSPSNPSGDTNSVMNGKYKNIYGNVIVEDCVPSPDNDYCKGKHVGNHCDLETGVCSGGNDVWLWKFVCDGETTDCRSNRVNSSNPQDGQSLTEGVTCGQTVQIDVFNKQCDEDPNNWSCNGENLIDYIVWYSGDCDPGQNACEQVDMGSVCPAGTEAKGGTKTCSEDNECSQLGNNAECANGCCIACDPIGGQTPTSTPSASPTDVVPSPTDTPTSSDPTATPVVTEAPTPTPTPSFNPAMCKCDEIEASSAIIAGGNVTFSAFGKVEGEDTNYARFTGMSFNLLASDGGTGGDVIKGSQGPVDVSVVEETANMVRYQSDWTVQIPSNIDPNKTYAVTATPNCERKTSAQTQSQPTVLGEETESKQTSFFGKIVNFFSSLFGAEQETADENGESADEDATLQQLRIRDIQPANVVQKTCNTVLFKFSEPSSN